ncbi:CHAP domain-containing protein [Candidatus Nanoperiomorbus periodonticus]|uniref:CHAP domain-containing protein n=1 Tax=Candidatus Nanoperiomorbus periodonticus TaxID=2171989 RepID=UPI00101C200D|nr:CHAP domain-containing protein [Candidatus Nanoperiomorbus periodonticus]RYC75900.1 hypothetical protein G52EAM_00145 [Candidatus Nanoperiomorbus periodonticus]
MATDNRRSNLGELEQSAANNPRSGTVPHYGGRYQAGSLTGSGAPAETSDDDYLSSYPQVTSLPSDGPGETGVPNGSSDYSGYSDYSPGSDYFDNLGKDRTGNDGQDKEKDQQGKGSNGPGGSGGDRSKRDLGGQERDASIDSSKFDGSMDGSKDKSKSGGLGGKKGVSAGFAGMGTRAVAGIAMLIILAFLVISFYLAGGLGRMIQAAAFLREYGLEWILGQDNVAMVTAASLVNKGADATGVDLGDAGDKTKTAGGAGADSRVASSTKSNSGSKTESVGAVGATAAGASTSDVMSDRVKKSRMGVLSLKYAKKMKENFEKNGLVYDDDGNGMTIDPARAFGMSSELLKKSGDSMKGEVAARLGVSPDKVTIRDGKVHLSRRLSYSETRRAISGMDNLGKWQLTGWLNTRAAMKRESYTRWLHPVQGSKSELYKKFQDWTKDQFSNIPANGSYLSEIAGAGGGGDAGGIAKVINQLKQERQEVADKNPEYTRSRVNSIVDKLKQFETFINSAMKMNGFKTTGLTIIIFMAGFVCMISKIYNRLGEFKYSNIVVPAEKEAGLYLGYASQMMSLSKDMNMKTLELATKSMLEDDIPEINSDGEATGKMVHSSYASSPAIAKNMGIAGSDRLNDNSGMQGILRTVGKPGFNFLPGRMNGMLNSLYTQYKNMVDVVCGIIDILFSGPLKNITEAIIDFIVGLVKKQFEALIANLFASNDEFWQVLTVMANWLVGQPLTTDIATPAEHGSNAMFGARYLANDQAMMTGGRKLSDKEAVELNLENRRYLAWRHSQKPMLARLFDPYDYSSSLNQIAYAANLNMGKQDIWLAMGNALKTIVSAPTIMATASNQLLGNNAYAASAYDYGVPMYGRSLSEMNEIINDDSQGLFKNADKAIGLFQIPPPPGEENPYIKYARECLLSEVSTSDYSVKPIDNSDGTKFNYADTSDEEDEGKSSHWRTCQQQATQPDYKAVRLYVMGYYGVVSIACYHGDDGDSESGAACKEVQVDDVSSGSKSSADGSGNVEATEMQKKFADETHGHYGAYSTSSNGCTTVTAWFIGEHTTLTYGHGNGNQVVKQLIAANPGKNLKSEPYPTKAPAIFSSVAGHMHASGGAGHTGVVTSVDPTTGTIHTLESGANNSMNGLSSPWSKTFEWKKEDYSSGVEFVYVGDYLK